MSRSSSNSRVKSVRYRTFGSHTRLLDEFVLPAPLYHAGRAGRWLAQHWRGTVTVLGVWVLGGLTGSLLVGMVLVGLAWGLTIWVLWRRAAEGGYGFSAKDALESQNQRRTLNQQWPLAAQSAGLVAPDRRTLPKLTRVHATGGGTIEATVASGKIGVPVPSIQKQTVTLAQVIGCREVVVTELDDRPGVATIAFHWRDAVGRHLPLADLPVTSAGNLSYGRRQDGSPATVKLTQSILLGGLSRSGKSTCVWTLLADAIRQRIPVHVYVSDPKGGVELDAFESMVDSEEVGLVKVRQYAKTPAETLKMLEAVEKAMHARQHWMKQNGVRKITPDATNPLVVVILDETLPLTDLLKKGTDSPLGRVAYTGAAAAYVVWANTQVAQVDALGRFRDLIPQRICFATPNPQVTDSVLGSGADAAGAKCHTIRQAGVGYSHSEGDVTPRKFRAAFVSDEETKMIAAGKLSGDVMDLYEVQHAEAGEGETLYRFYNDAGELLYVGKSNDYFRRNSEHARSKPWYKEVASSKLEHFPSRKAVLDAEKRAILLEKPRYNDQHNRTNPNRVKRVSKKAVTAKYHAARTKAKAGA